jgi:tetratricopeptide (TPR) repeat protein
MSEDRLRPHWIDGDLDATQKNFEAALAAEATDAGRAEVLSQLARVQSLRGRPDLARTFLDDAAHLAGDDPVARARVLLERGRVARRYEDDKRALSLLERAYEAALGAGQHFMAADAAHACALAGDMVGWTRRGLELAERFPAAAYWRGTLLINLGEWQLERGECERSLQTFEDALVARGDEMRNPALTEHARYGIASALLELDRPAEAVPLLEQVVAWADHNDVDWPDARQALTRARAEAGR